MAPRVFWSVSEVHPSKFFPVVVPETGPRGVAPQLVLPEVYDKAMKESAVAAVAAKKHAQNSVFELSWLLKPVERDIFCQVVIIDM